MKIAEIFKEESGKYSFGRIVGSFAFFSYLLFAGYSVYAKNDFPDIPGNLALLIGSLYGLNKLVNMIKQ